MAKKQGRATGKKATGKPSRVVSGIVGGILIGLAGAWAIWLLLHQFSASIPMPPGLPPAQNATPVSQISPLAAEGITLSPASQTPTIGQQQALHIAQQLEPDAAASAKQTTAQYVLVTYPVTGTPAAHANLHNTPVWLIAYQNVPLTPGDSSASGQSTYNLYVFLDASSGKELLVVRV
jgi:hypothetical protein